MIKVEELLEAMSLVLSPHWDESRGSGGDETLSQITQ